ncbi:alpha/beta hydrolase [Paucisalibacillus sp. EB02]|uniref:alpha/beta hydrolase n=1 Tax=Paucisalibacillus sp. EB02 TaxID=1347087 RepID=UPI0004AFF95F|nr:alpha/beta hydrolase [Paucisalibacillus sp. EB02]
MSEAKFVALQKEVFQLFHEGKMDEVQTLIEKVQQAFPKRIDKTLFWKACAFSIQEKFEQAIGVLQDGLKNGVWWNPFMLTRDPDLSGLQDFEEFQEVVRQCENILENHKHKATPQLLTFGNHQADVGIFSLHMRGSNAKDFVPHWLDDYTSLNYFFGFSQSSQVFGYNAYCWDDPETADVEIQSAFQEFKQQGSTKHDILAGASQGGKLAIEWCLAQKVDVKGFIAVIPSIRDLSEFESLLKTNNFIPMKGSIITGDQDPFYEKTIQLVELLERYNIPCKLTIVKGLGHFIPDNFRALLTEAVDFVLGSE